MHKKKVLNVIKKVLKTSARVLILNIPAVIILLSLLVADKISWLSAFISLLGFWAISTVIVLYVFKDLDTFMAYLKKLAQGIEPELPKLRWGIFSSMRLTNTFLSVKNLWSDQFLSDRSVLENLPSPLLMLDKNQKIVFANLSAQSFFTMKLINQKLSTAFKDKTLLKAFSSVLKTQKSFTLEEWTFKNHLHQSFSFQVRVDHLPAPTKKGAIIALSFFDITPFQLFKTQQADFFANASHELKTPLAIINGCVETLQTSAKNDKKAQQQFLTLIAEQSARMTQLVQKMLKLSRLQMDIPLTEYQTFSMNDLIQKVVDDFQLSAKHMNKKIILNKHPHLPLFSGSRDDFYHLFQNLIDNALKYSAPCSQITVSTYLDTVQKKQLVISVHNIGNPISPDQLNRIWDKFYRVEQNASSLNGFGLGLGIVQHLVKRYNGSIQVESSHQKGTTFYVYLPTDV